MSKSNDHSNLINGAAKAVLRPLGFRQKGRSRVWFADRGYWALIVEFQPSGFGKGSYLNIAASWLWGPRAWAFDHVFRTGGFVRLESLDQFQPEAQRLAKAAADETGQLDREFASLEKIAAHLKKKAEDSRLRQNPWTLYHAAIACGLTGERDFSVEYFEELRAQKPSTPWTKELLADGGALAQLLESDSAFQDAVRQKVERTRSAMKLPPLP